jgi:hypothetical protein
MAELPQYQDTQPVIQQQNIASKADGADAWAKTLGSIAGEAGQKASEMADEQSQTMYINSVANMEQLKTSAQMQLLEHPDQAPKIADNMTQASDMVKQAAFVNKKDRARLNAYIDATSDQVALDATRTNVHQTQLMAAYSHYANWPDQLKAYQQSLMKDDGTADKLKDAMTASLKNLVSIGALTPEQAGSSIKSMGGMVDVVRDHVALYGNPNASAQDYHTVTSSLLNKNPADNVNTPINENTGWAVNYYSQDRSFQGVLSDIYNRTLPNPMFFDSLQPSQREHAIMTMQGVRQADGIINSGTPLPVMQGAYDDLNQRGRVLNYREQGLRNSLGVYLNRVKNGNYLDAIQSTPSGGAILHDYVNRNAAISNSPMGDQDKVKFTLDNLNSMVNRAVSYGYGHNFAPDKIQPIPAPIVDSMEQGFKAGNNPQVILDTIQQFRPENRPWLAQAMKNPRQQVVVQTVNLAGDTVKPTDKLEFIAANQVGQQYLKVNEGQSKSNMTDPKILGLIASSPEFKAASTVIGAQYDPYKAPIIQRELANAALNYIKYQGEKTGDFMLTNKDAYIKQASNIIANAFPKISSTNYVANPKQINITPSEMDILAHYVIKQGEDFLKGGVKESVFMSAIERNPLKMTLSPTNEVLAVDGNNKVYWHAPFTPDMMGAARQYYQQQTKDAEKLQQEIMFTRYGAGGIP